MMEQFCASCGERIASECNCGARPIYDNDGTISLHWQWCSFYELYKAKLRTLLASLSAPSAP